MSDAAAALSGAVIGGVFVLAGVWFGAYLNRKASDSQRQKEKVFALHRHVEQLRNIIMAFQQKKIDDKQFYRRWTYATEETMGALFGSRLSKEIQKRVLRAINGKWDDPKTVKDLGDLSDDILEAADPAYAAASRELLRELGVKKDEIEPIILDK